MIRPRIAAFPSLLFPALALTSAPALAEGSSAPETRSFGTATETVLTVGAFAFAPLDSATTFAGDGFNGRYATASVGCFEASVFLPAGAKIDYLELKGCDTSASGDVAVSLYVCQGASCSVPCGVATGDSATPGCFTFASGTCGVTVNNFGNEYTVQVCTTALDSTTVFEAVRLYYFLQVSPAPGSATFGDVPTNHPYFRAIEALAKSGITSGCGGSNFCPNQNVTRGEMAKFLANALGLHWQ